MQLVTGQLCGFSCVVQEDPSSSQSFISQSMWESSFPSWSLPWELSLVLEEETNSALRCPRATPGWLQPSQAWDVNPFMESSPCLPAGWGRWDAFGNHPAERSSCAAKHLLLEEASPCPAALLGCLLAFLFALWLYWEKCMQDCFSGGVSCNAILNK